MLNFIHYNYVDNIIDYEERKFKFYYDIVNVNQINYINLHPSNRHNLKSVYVTYIVIDVNIHIDV